MSALALVTLAERAANAVDSLYEAGCLDAAEDLDALLADVEELLEENGDYEDGGDLENDELSEVDEDGAHEFATTLPEDEVHDDDLDFAWERGRYAPEHLARHYDETDDDLEFSLRLDRAS
ncbi:MAG: hypothetical protein AB2L07_16165 [Thermoanaerobaculaceae bacterium]